MDRPVRAVAISRAVLNWLAREAAKSELSKASQGRLYDGRTLSEWESIWEPIGTLADEN